MCTTLRAKWPSRGSGARAARAASPPLRTATPSIRPTHARTPLRLGAAPAGAAAVAVAPHDTTPPPVPPRRPRDPSEASSDAHDIPVLVRAGGAEDALATASLAAWRARQEDHAGVPRCECDRGAFFTSLGNGHFTQALNLFRLGWPSIWDGQPWAPPAGASGDALRAALAHGVESLVLRAETPRGARKEISLLLNKAHDSKWHVDRASGAVVVTPPLAEVRVSQFDELSKVLDADELGALLRIKLRVDEAAADAGYAALLQSKL